METAPVLEVELSAHPLRPVARWTPCLDEAGRRRLVMVWSVPDPDACAPGRSMRTTEPVERAAGPPGAIH
jgi:hypothetical protein